MSLIGGAIAQVFPAGYGSISPGSLASLTENIFVVLLKLSVFPMLLLAVIGRTYFL